jgi:transcriptional regulator of acetoin/glycerol metabolism
MDELVAHDWPGNVRELSNVLEQAVITSTDGTLRLRSRLTKATRADAAPEGQPGDQGTLEDVERRYVLQVLGGSGWRIEGEGGAARRLGLHPNTLRNRMRKLGIQRPGNGPRGTEA